MQLETQVSELLAEQGEAQARLTAGVAAQVGHLAAQIGDVEEGGAAMDRGSTVWGALEALGGEMDELTTKMKEGGAWVSKDAFLGGLRRMQSAFERALQELRADVDKISVYPAFGGASGDSRPSGSHSTALEDSVKTLDGSIKGQEMRLARIERSLKAEETMVKIGTIGFSSFEEVVEFLHVEAVPRAGEYFAYWVDVFTSAEIVRIRTNGVEQSLKTHGDVARANPKDGDLQMTSSEYLMCLAAHVTLPSNLGTAGKSKEPDFPLPLARKYEQWDHVDSQTPSIASTWEDEMAGFVQNLDSELEFRWNHPETHKFAKVAETLAHGTLNFIRKLRAFVESFRRNLKHNGGGDDEVWSLISAMMVAIFKHLADARRMGVSVLEDRNRLTRSARMLWGAYQCHREMQEFVRSGFDRHPCVVPALTRHMFERKASRSKVEALEKEVKVLKAAMEDAGKVGARVQATVDKAVASAVAPLRDQIKRLEAGRK